MNLEEKINIEKKAKGGNAENRSIASGFARVGKGCFMTQEMTALDRAYLYCLLRQAAPPEEKRGYEKLIFKAWLDILRGG